MRRVPQDTGEERLIREAEISRTRRAGAEVLSVQQLGLVPEFVPAVGDAGGSRSRAPGRANALAEAVRRPQRGRGTKG